MQCPACSAPLLPSEARCVSCHALVNPAAQGSSALAPRLVTPQAVKGPEAPVESSLESLVLETSETLPSSAPVRSTPDAEWRREVLERVRKRRQVRTHALPLFVEGASAAPEASPASETPRVESRSAAPPPMTMSTASLSLDEEVVEEVAEVVELADPRPATPAPDLIASLDVAGADAQDSVFDLPLRPVEHDAAASSPRARAAEIPTQSLVERPRPTLVAGNRSLVADLPLVEPSRVEPPPTELPSRRPASAVASRAASMNDRLQAAFIDVGMWSAMCVTAFYFASRIARTSILGLAPAWPGLLLFAVVIAAAYMLFFGGLSGATPGKIACGIQVRRYDGSSLGPLPSLGRGFLGILGVAFLGVGIWPAFWDRDRRTLHDRATDSRVTTV